jgi:zinc transport system substrate-binding protein
VKRIARLYWFISLLLLQPVGLYAGETLDIVCTTTHLSAIATAVGGENVKVTTLIPYGMCPGHFELTPVQVSDLKQADIILAHGYEHFLDNLIQKTDIKIDRLDIVENAILPAIHIEIAGKVTEILIRCAPNRKIIFLQNLEVYKKKVSMAEREVKAMMPCFNDVFILCADMNRTFLEWLGCAVVASFPRDEDLSLKSMHTVLKKARQNKTQLVIDNLQSSGKAGKTFAEELQIPLIIITNFPPDNDYIVTLRHNCTSIFNALGCN